jgi:hypothetical protein
MRSTRAPALQAAFKRVHDALEVGVSRISRNSPERFALKDHNPALVEIDDSLTLPVA